MFSVFDEDGKWNESNGEWPSVDLYNFATGAVTVDVKIAEIGNGNPKKYESIFFAGHIANEILEDDATLRPKIGWGLALK